MNTLKRLLFTRCLLAAAGVAAVLPSAVQAQAAAAPTAPAWPTKVVTLVVPYTANSGSDIIARIVAPRLSARWGQPVIVDNRPGASGNIGTNAVAKAPADGYTLLMMINSITMAASLYKDTPYNLATDLAPVAKLAEAGFAIAVNPNVPAKDMASLIAVVKKTPGTMSYGSPGAGTPQHLGMVLFNSRYGLDSLHVPYKGIAGALTDLMGGQVQMMYASVHSLLPGIQGGRVRLLAVTGAQRNPLAPDVPTFREQGIEVMDSIDAYYGVMAPARTPPELVARLNRDFIAVLGMEDVKAELAKLGLSVRTSTPEQFDGIVKGDLARWRKVIQDARITAE